MTEDEALEHLRQTFSEACRDFLEVMEPYLNREDDPSKEFMRAALRETFKQRFPSRFAKAA